MKSSVKKFLIYLAVPLVIGAIAAFFIRDYVPLYEDLKLPPFAPPSWLFPVVWTLLYILMGISSYIVGKSHSSMRTEALILYGIQLFLNFLWPLVFFIAQNYLLAFILLVLTGYVLLKMIREFNQIQPLAGKLQFPYFIWLLYAGYLNLAVYLMNL